MAKNSKNGKESEVTKRLVKEQSETEKRQAELEAEMRAIEAAKLEAAQAESDNQTAPVAVVEFAPDKERKAAWEAFLTAYEAQNPVKFAAKKAAGAFKEIPATFTGKDELKN